MEVPRRDSGVYDQTGQCVLSSSKTKAIILDICKTSANKQKMMVTTLKSSRQGALICGLTSFIGGVLGGPIGLAVGGTIGGMIVVKTSSDFLPVSTILQNASEEERGQLLNILFVEICKCLKLSAQIYMFKSEELWSLVIHEIISSGPASATLMKLINSQLINYVKAHLLKPNQQFTQQQSS